MAVAMPVMSNGGKTYTIKLKPGILFQPPVSREVTADDFKYSFERMMRLPNAPGTYFYTNVVGATDYQAGKATHVAGYKALDKYTIQIDLEQPDLAFLNALTVDFCDPIPKEWVAKWGNRQVARHPLGTGPFMFESWTPGQEIVLARNPNYRDAAQRVARRHQVPAQRHRAVGLPQAAARRRRRARQQRAAGQRAVRS